MNLSFNNLPLATRQAAINAILVPAVKRLPLRIKRNPSVMGSIVKFAWDSCKNGQRLTRTSLRLAARALETPTVAL